MKTTCSALAFATALIAMPAQTFAETAADTADGTSDTRTIIVTAPQQSDPIDNAPNTHVAVTEESIGRTVNAMSVEDTIKYLPSLVVRKRHIGDNFAPIATRTSGLGASARSLIYADGVLLSALIANNNGNGSPRWGLVTPEEVARIDVLYGPFSAAYSGNSIGTVVNITTRMPDRLEVRASALANVQQFSLYGTNRTLPTHQFSVSAGGAMGALHLFASATRTAANSQPISFTTLTGTLTTPPTRPTGTTGGYADLNKLGQQILVLGAGGLEHHVQDTFKLKAAYDLSAATSLTYVLGVWRDNSHGTVESYETGAAGALTYATANNGTTGFNSAVYGRDAQHFSHALTLKGRSPQLDWQVTGTLYHYARDNQNNPSPDTGTSNGAAVTSASTGFIATRNDLPGAFAGGSGTIARQQGTGWATLDARLTASLDSSSTLSIGAHADRTTLNAATYTIANWLDRSPALGQLRSASHGNTRMIALWAQDVLKLSPAVTLTIGGREEFWRAYGGTNTTLNATVKSTVAQGERTFSGFSPKLALEVALAPQWNLRLSAGQAFRMPTVGELYQTTTVGTLLANPNPGLAPERARSGELALEHRSARGVIRLALFNEVIDNALISQTGTFTPVGGVPTAATFVQNVDRTRARGLELAVEQIDVIPHVDVSGSVTYADAITSKNTAFPAAVGKLLPSVPHWKASAVLTWRASEAVSLTTAARFASRNYANLDNSDIVGNTYQGFYKYFVIDARAVFKVTGAFSFALGVDNLNNARYFLFHPFPQRSFTAEVKWKL